MLTKCETDLTDVHVYDEMEWVDGEASGELELRRKVVQQRKLVSCTNSVTWRRL